MTEAMEGGSDSVGKGGDETIQELVADGSQRSVFTFIAWVVGLWAVLALVVAILIPVLFRPSLNQRANRYLALPKGATVTNLQEGKVNQDVDLWFRIPEPKGSGSREGEIWTELGLPPPVALPVGFHTTRYFPRPSIASPTFRKGIFSRARPAAKSKLVPKAVAGPRAASPLRPASPLRSVRALKPVRAVKTVSSEIPGITFVKGPTYSIVNAGFDRTTLTFDKASARYHFTRKSE